jgi:predicted nucleotidyltransferase component of viral defense system
VDKSILTKKQKLFLSLLAKDKAIADAFYLTGGTALGEFYIPFRYSEDLDFFSEKEIDLPAITVFIKSIKNSLDYNKFDINSSFNRNVVQLLFEGEVLKTEFTYFPFTQIEKPKKKMGVYVDSLIDIAVNKLFTIYQKPRSRDYMDLFMIIKKEVWGMEDLIKKARAKFDWQVDSLKLGTQFLKAKEVKDYPRLIVKLGDKDWQNFFVKEAEKLKKDILK